MSTHGCTQLPCLICGSKSGTLTANGIVCADGEVIYGVDPAHFRPGDKAIVYGEPFTYDAPRTRHERAIALLGKGRDRLYSADNEEHQADFEGEEPTHDSHAQRFNREHEEARHQDGERIKALEERIAQLTKERDELRRQFVVEKTAKAILQWLCNEQAKQLEDLLKAKQPTLRSEHVILVDIQDVD